VSDGSQLAPVTSHDPAVAQPPPVRVEWSPAAVPEGATELARGGVSPHLAELLARRGVSDLEAAEAFLTPAIEHLHDPFLLAGLAAAVDRLERARERTEKVAVVGDYDVDGITATALLLAVLRSCRLEVEAVLPHRLREGYGFQPVHVERALELGCRLIVTVDCGVSAGEAVAKAIAAGIDVIITDHHLPGEALPPGAILVNPRQPGCDYPFTDLAGVGLALKLAMGLARRLEREIPLPALLRIACLGTIADLVPLQGENRVIAALGLAALPETPSVGLRALIEKAGLRPPFKASDVGFRLGPRLNAAGRLASPDHALNLLLCRDVREARRLAEELEQHNRQRQDEERRVVDEARNDLLSRGGDLPPILVAWSATWHRGVVGIAAGRLARELARPAVLLAVDGEQAVGSGRSIAGIDLHEFLGRSGDELERFGGHAQAVGMTAATARLDSLRLTWERAAAQEWPEACLRRRHEYELSLTPAELTPDLLAELSRLEPHGQGNPQPLLRVGPLRLAGPPRLFGKGHLAARALEEGGGDASVALLGWRWQDRQEKLAGCFEALGFLEEDTWRGGPVLRLVDSRPC